MLAALGVGPEEHLARGGAALAGLPDDGLSGLAAVRERLRGQSRSSSRRTWT